MVPETCSTEEQIYGPPPVCIAYCCVYSHDAVQASGTSYPKRPIDLIMPTPTPDPDQITTAKKVLECQQHQAWVEDDW